MSHEQSPAKPQSRERRRWARRELILDLRVRTPSGADLGRVGDLAVGGVQLIHRGKFFVGQELALSIDLPHSLAAGSALSFRGICRWVGSGPGFPGRCGIEFVDPTAEQQEILKSLIGRFVGELCWEVRTEVHEVVVHLRGALDERAAIDELVAELAPPYRFDLADLMRVTSYGARCWVQLVARLAGAGPVELRRCSPAFVAHLNMIAGFRGAARIHSVNAPFVCERCDLEYAVEIDTASGHADLPAPGCATCGRPLVFDDIPARYFAFLGSP